MNEKTAGLPDLDNAPSDSDDAVAVRNSPKTKLAVIVFSLVIVVAAGVAMKGLLFPSATAPASVADEGDGNDAASEPTGAAVPASQPLTTLTTSGQSALAVNDPLDAQTGDATAFAGRLNRIDDRLDALAQAQSGLRRDLTAATEALQPRLSAIESSLSALSSRIDALRQGSGNDAMTRLTAQLEQLDQRVKRVERRTHANWKQLHGEAGARRRGASLPFRVGAIDLWNGQPSVAIHSNEGQQFLSVGDTLAGWRLVSADPGTGRAHFTRNGLDATVEVGR